MSIGQRLLGKLEDGKEVKLYTFSNAKGVTVEINKLWWNNLFDSCTG